MLFGAAVHQLSARFAQPLHGKRWTCAVAQQPLQCGPVVCLNAHTGIYREAAVLVGQHVFGLGLLDQAPPDKGPQDAPVQIGLHLCYDCLVDSTGRVKNDARRCGCGISINFTWRHLENAVNHANMEVRMLVQAGAEPVNEGHCADMQGCFVPPAPHHGSGQIDFAQ